MFGSRLRALRKEQGLSQKDLAAKLFVSPQAVGKWERDEATPNPETVLKTAKLLGVSTDALLGESGERDTSNNGIISIPVLGAIPAGIPLEAIEDIIDREDIPASMCTGGKEYFGLQVVGDSMYPEYLEGDTVIVRKTPCCDSGDVCVVYVNGYDATLKQVKFGKGGEITLVPRNTSYPPRTYTPKEVEGLPVSIAGVVVELRRKIRRSQ